MGEIIEDLLSGFTFIDALDISIVAFIIYKILQFIKETRAQQLVRGLVVLIGIFFISDLLNFYVLNWVLKSTMTIGIFVLVVLFQPELRRGLEYMGRSGIVRNSFRDIDKEHAKAVVNLFIKAVDKFSQNKTGALIVIEKQTLLNDIVETGTIVNSNISVELLGNLFYEGAPLHDGAVIVRGDRIHAAGCVLPLTQNKKLSKDLGTRHRAGIGITEKSDSITIIVSEETGVISIAENGYLQRFLDQKALEKKLLSIYVPTQRERFQFLTRFIGGKKNDK
ncbi:MAG TPA: diadenylate cyclase CdaA [Anaerovoracaceae bacterium]|nr:diadenylate cyclase CdaA [Anaerovoracaceae bacterium]